MEILRLYRKRLSLSAIARETGHDRKTVRAVVARGGIPLRQGRRGGVPKFQKLVSYRDFLDERIRMGVTNASVLLDEIRSRGYQGGYTAVKQYVRPHRPARAGATPVVRFETLPGEQAQADFFDLVFRLPDGRGWRVHLFLYVLGYSRLMWGRFFERETRVQFHRGLDEAFRLTEGVPATVLHDRLSPCVTGRGENGGAVFAAEYLAFARHYGFTPRACRARRAQTKGKVERPGDYVQENFIPRLLGRLTSPDLGLLNRLFREWCEAVANVRLHGTVHERPVDRYGREETGALGPLPAFAFGLDEIGTRRVQRDCLVRWKSTYHRVPVAHCGKQVLVRETPVGDAVIEFQGHVVKTYPLATDRYAVMDDPTLHQAIWEAATGLRRFSLADAPVTEERPLAVYEELAGV